TAVEATVGGEALKDISEARVTGNGVTATIIAVEEPQADKGPKKRNAPNPADGPAWVRVKVDIAADAAPGERDLRLIGADGASNRFRFFVGGLPEVVETEPNSDPASAQQVESLPVVVNGQALKGDRDCYRFAAKQGQTIVCEARARRILPYIGDAVPGWFQACLTLYDSRGNRLEYVDDVLFKPDPVLVF
ncbi:MAG: peptidase, partial [bacterium]|nr:peptidase [bacterium]